MANDESTVDLDLVPAAYRTAHAQRLASKVNRNARYGMTDARYRAVAQWANGLEDAELALQARLSLSLVSVLEHGADPDADDNAAAVQAAIDAAEVAGMGVLVPAGTFDYASGLTNPAAVPIVCVGTLRFTGSGEHALTIGDEGAQVIAAGTLPSVLRVQRAAQDWTDAFAGIRVLNLYEWHATIHVSDFECGLVLEGLGEGCAYNRITLQRAYGCRVGIRFYSNAAGWCNDNAILGGRIGNLQATSSALNVHGFEFLGSSAISVPNGNKVHDTSIELYNVGAGYTSAMHGRFTTGTRSGQNNVLDNLRIEQTEYWVSGDGFGGTAPNVIGINYLGPNESLSANLLNGDTAAAQLVLVQNRFIVNTAPLGAQEPIRIAGFDRRNVVAVSTNVWRPARGASWRRSTTSLANTCAGTIDDEGIQITNADGLAVVLDLRNCTRDFQRMITAKAQVRATGGRFYCVLWDSSRTLLTAAEHCSLTFNGSTNYYRTGSDMTADAAETNIAFSDSVAFALVGVASGTVGANISSFDVFALGMADIRPLLGAVEWNALSSTPATIAPIDTGDPIANATPSVPGTASHVPTGTICRNVEPASGEASAWIYTGSAWLPLANIP